MFFNDSQTFFNFLSSALYPDVLNGYVYIAIQ
jgi:hypothetical protein